MRAEELLHGFESETDEALTLASAAVTDEEIDRALLRAGEARLRAYSFSHALLEASGRSIYRRKWDYHNRLSRRLQDRWDKLKYAVFRSPLPREALEVLEQLRAVSPPPTAVDGEAEFRAGLRANKIVEVDPDDYNLRPRQRFPSRE